MTISKLLGACILPCLLLVTTAGLRTKPVTREVPPEKALATFQLPDNFQIELVASEPLLSDPVAMEIDEYGRMYVVEMHGYPLDKSGTGKVRILEDADGDGKMDKTTVFAEGLVLPTGIMRWKKGILVTDPPNVLYLEDRDGDGRSDIRDTLLTGFAMSNPQHNFNNPLLGIDNWIYLGHEPAVTAKVFQEEFGDRGGEIFYPKEKGGKTLPQNALGRSVRFNPDRKDIEILSSYTQFGHTFDKWGRYLLVSNANPGYHEVIAARYLNRNPDLLVSNVTQSISDHSSEVFPITKNPLHQLLTDVGVFTSACGITSYQGGLFPAPFDSVTLVAEPVSNIVHADIIRDKGASFTASRLYKDKEFLASTDPWFRPVNMYIGPDGALYVVDYYRQIIEHPEWMADDVIKSGALYNGVDKGRIYRITPKGTAKASWTKNLKLGDAPEDELVQQLANPNIWWRRNAQRLLLDRNPQHALPALEKMASNAASPAGRLHALWTLEGLNKLGTKTIVHALQDKEAGVRENAVRLAELHLQQSPELSEKLLNMRNDANAKVRFQLLATLGFVDTPQAAEVRQAILFRDLNDPWVQIAALSAPTSGKGVLMDAVLKNYKPAIPAYASLVERLSTMAGTSGDTAAIKKLVRNALTNDASKGKPLTKADWRPALLHGLAQSMKKPKDPGALKDTKTMLLQAALSNPSAALREASLRLLKTTGLPQSNESVLAMQRSAKLAADPNAAPERRNDAIQFLSLDNPAKYEQILKKLVAPHEPRAIQLTALKTLSAIPDETVSHFLLENWPSLTPDLRDVAISTFMVNDKRIKLLLDGVESGKIHQESIGWPRSVGLMAQGNEALRNRSRALLTKKDDTRQGIIKKYNEALSLTGNASSGKMVYQKNCSVCHQIGGSEGVAFGPDLGTIRNRRPESIVGDILDPNLSIADGYDIWIIELKAGESVQGLIANETPTAITVSNYGGQKTVIARKDIKSLKALGMSSMPAGLEAEIDQQAMADLLAYIKQPK
ncbi:PVC-type heme-binding CxxCH protein [Dyadobacter chenhuakuii]|uniref:C-type cytochrome n=1 Tax=Dyadobacter chenhuakuii TaxID=2909339 RepID=A0ABY4XSH7_9BACT|nr:PVC-type heme-binding CxxCH protein [Dyadobacter chenhuakuii]MCF2492352.1 c-type cytochrome [Dyadobacter chenhuakuii]USJ33345.1 c-type cytochrome [Dyadobacter chenhuakuii]